MDKYYNKIRDTTALNVKSFDSVANSEAFHALSNRIVTGSTLFQKSIQEIIYAAYHKDVEMAGKSLKDLVSPKSRLNFIESYNNVSDDEDILTVFRYAKQIFVDIYDLRNSLSHEIWLSSDQFDGCLLLSSLDEEARLLSVKGKLIHVDGTNTLQVFNAIIRFIESIKIVSLTDLNTALKDIELCNWCLMQIEFFLKENNKNKKADLKNAFFIFKGVSHLFPEQVRQIGSLNWKSSFNKSINI